MSSLAHYPRMLEFTQQNNTLLIENTFLFTDQLQERTEDKGAMQRIANFLQK